MRENKKYKMFLSEEIEKKEIISIFVENGCSIYYELLLETENLFELSKFVIFLKAFSERNESLKKIYPVVVSIYKKISIRLNKMEEYKGR